MASVASAADEGPVGVAPPSASRMRRNRRFVLAFHLGRVAATAEPLPGLETSHTSMPIVAPASCKNDCYANVVGSSVNGNSTSNFGSSFGNGDSIFGCSYGNGDGNFGCSYGNGDGNSCGIFGNNPTYEGVNPTSRKGYGRTGLQSCVKAAPEGVNPASLAGYGETGLQSEAVARAGNSCGNVEDGDAALPQQNGVKVNKQSMPSSSFFLTVLSRPTLSQILVLCPRRPRPSALYACTFVENR